MATTGNRGAVEADIVPPCQRDTGHGAVRPVGVFLFGLFASSANELRGRRGRSTSWGSLDELSLG